jgi:hypothetical protein
VNGAGSFMLPLGSASPLGEMPVVMCLLCYVACFLVSSHVCVLTWCCCCSVLCSEVAVVGPGVMLVPL